MIETRRLTTMRRFLQTAHERDVEFCEVLSRENMRGYLLSRGIVWDSQRYLRSWFEFENFLIIERGRAVGLLRLLPEPDALAVRDLQVLPGCQGSGIGSWAIEQTKFFAKARGFVNVRLRVYEDNPAQNLYVRLGFTVDVVADGVIHMLYKLPSGH